MPRAFGADVWRQTAVCRILRRVRLRDIVRFNSVIERADRFFGSYNAAPLYYSLAFRVAASWGVSCFNYGFAPLSPELAGDAECAEPYQLEMYRQAATLAGVERFRCATVLEISCGLGGGLAHLTRAFGIASPIAL
ncbi:MAG TPA: hypothetical protein VHV78_01405, partial [Gemmatimonadaceae bacterium]|nr:hypothetical protein [Gemmatimonadaceae bacterium]